MKHLLRVFDGYNKAGLYIATILLSVVGILILGSLPIAIVMMIQSLESGELLAPDFNELPYYQSLLLQFSTFVIGVAVLFGCIRIFHKRGFRDVINGGRPVRWGHFFSAFGLYILLMALVMGLLMVFNPENFILQFDAGSFFPALIVLLVCVPFQTFFEEYLFRGYLMQASAAWTRRVWVALLLPALLFGLAHSANPEVGAYGFVIMMAQYLLFGLIFGWFTLSDDGLEVSWGMHTANNLFLLIFFTSANTALPTPAVWMMVDAAPVWSDILEMVAVTGVIWLILKRKYKWELPRLFGRLEAPAAVSDPAEGLNASDSLNADGNVHSI